jgi:Fur family ferric uptake transcriptional regulator
MRVTIVLQLPLQVDTHERSGIYLQPGAIAMSCLETLKGKGLKLTPQRRLIVDIIHDSHAHLSAEEIIDHVQKRMPGVNKSTIYRTLDILEEAGSVVKSDSGGRFIYHHAEEGHHHHLVCSGCGRTEECSEDLFRQVEGLLEDKYGFRAHFHHAVIAGLCSHCMERR